MHKNEPSSHSHTHKPARKHAEASITQSTPHPSAISPPRPARPAQHSPRCTLSRAKVVTNSLLPPPPPPPRKPRNAERQGCWRTAAEPRSRTPAAGAKLRAAPPLSARTLGLTRAPRRTHHRGGRGARRRCGRRGCSPRPRTVPAAPGGGGG